VPAPTSESARLVAAKFVEQLASFKVDRATLNTAREEITELCAEN
jgi:hypothetical protein